MPSRERMMDALGFAWDQTAVRRDIPSFSVDRAAWRFLRALPEFVWDAAVLECNPLTLQEVRKLLDGITVAGRKISDERQVLNLAEAARELARLVKDGQFRLAKEIYDSLHFLVARDEALEAGHFRGEGKETLTPGVNLGEYGRYLPPATEKGGANLRQIHARGVEFIIGELGDVFEQGIAYFLFGALQQFRREQAHVAVHDERPPDVARARCDQRPGRAPPGVQLRNGGLLPSPGRRRHVPLPDLCRLAADEGVLPRGEGE